MGLKMNLNPFSEKGMKIFLAEAPSFGKTIFKYKLDSHGEEDYLNLCREIIGRG
jgi:cellulose biosynthesis protein BcsQ